MQKKKSTENLSINKIRDELDAEVCKIFTEFYTKNFAENDAELGRHLGISGSTSKYYREGMQIPGWVLLYIWQHAPGLLRDRVIDRAMATDPCAELNPEECVLLKDFAKLLVLRRKVEELKVARGVKPAGTPREYTKTEIEYLEFLETVLRGESARDLKSHAITEVIHGTTGTKAPSKSNPEPTGQTETGSDKRNSRDSKSSPDKKR